MTDIVLARQLLDRLRQAPQGDEFRKWLCCSPLLLRQSVRDEMRSTSIDDAAQNLLKRIDAVAPQLLSGQLKFVLGATPIELVCRAVERGEAEIADAMKLAATPLVVSQLLPIYVGCLADHAVELAHSYKWREALLLLKICRAALVAAAPSTETIENMNSVESSFVEIAIWSLLEVPDRRLLADAEQCGLRVVERTSAKPRDDCGLALMRLGVLFLDPFVKGRDLHNPRWAYAQWDEAFAKEYGASAALVPQSEWQMPAWEEAIPKAIDYLKRASSVRKGRLRGRSLKALAEAYASQAALSDAKDKKLILKTARKALALLDSRLDAIQIKSLRNLIERNGGRVRSASTGGPLSVLNGLEKVDFILTSVQEMAASEPLAALEMLRDARQVFDEHVYPQKREERLVTMARLIRPAFVPNEQPSGWGHDWDTAVEVLISKHASGILGGHKFAVCALYVAMSAAKENSEQRAIPLIKLAVESDATFAELYAEVFQYITFTIYSGAGVNYFNEKRFSESATAYLCALGAALSLRLQYRALDMLERVNDVLKNGEAGFPDHSLELLGSNWLECENQLGERGSVELNRAAAQLDRYLGANSAEDINTAWLLWQIAKGLRFSKTSPTYNPNVSYEESDLLREIRDVEKQIAHGGANNLDVDEKVLVSWLRPRGGSQGLSNYVRLRNLQRTFDDCHEKRLVSNAGEPRLVSGKEATELLDPNTALVSLFLGESPGGKLAVRWLYLSHSLVTSGRIDHEESRNPHVIQEDGYELVVPPLGDVTCHLRELLRGDPGFGQLGAQATELLDVCGEAFLGRVPAIVASRPEIKYLCVCPHGPLHFLPLHLLGPAGRPLSDIAVISYLPNLSLLGRRNVELNEGLAAVGLSFAVINPRQLTPLVDAPLEAAEIASRFDTKPVPEDEATPSRVLEVLQKYRFVHIATHGAQNAVAPAFHHLVLRSGVNGEDRLFAHEIDNVDLSGLDMVTLSACETALGRVDPSDNPRGISSSLLRAGARTVIGTLWPTGSKSCRTFFSALYGALHIGASKRDAFANAQAETRRRHPQYRAWGSFYMMGNWN